jgi:hypothetical protein
MLSIETAYAASPPTIESEWSSSVSITTADVEASINRAGADTTFQVEYGPDASYGATEPVPAADIGSGEAKTVKQHLTDLHPGTVYHYRVVATNEGGSTPGQDRTFTTFAQPSEPVADTCPNAAFRVGYSAALPDCRALEMVSPVNKNGADVSADRSQQVVASESGDRVVYMAKTGFGETHGSGFLGYEQFVAERNVDGWAGRGITPTPDPGDGVQIFSGLTFADEFSTDLGLAALAGYNLPGSPAGAKPETENLYLEDTVNGTLAAVVTDSSNEGEAVGLPSFFLSPELGGASASLDVVTFMSRVNYVPEAHGSQYKAYVYEHGNVKLLGVLPDGSVPPEGSRLVNGPESIFQLPWATEAIAERDTVSTDGSRILFEVQEHPHQLYMRKNSATSALVTESETSEPVTAEEVTLQAASRDLTHIVFSSSSQLTEDAPAGGGLYLYTDGPSPTTEKNLTFVAHATQAFGVSDDGSRIYYDGGQSVMLWDSGKVLQIAPESGIPNEGIGQVEEPRITPDGRLFAFANDRRLTKDAEVGELPLVRAERNMEIYVYNEEDGSLKCASCPTTGARAMLGVETSLRATEMVPYTNMDSKTNFFSREGRYAFFNTQEALLPQDTNGTTDAYEYDTITGQVSLLSSGTGEAPSWFVDASADGRNVFIITRQQLSRWDPDKLVDLYDARVDGGLPEPPVPAAGCTEDACQGIPSTPPTFSTASAFTGLGNPTFSGSVRMKPKPRSLARLRRALQRCKKKSKHKRTRCERAARKRYRTGRAAEYAGPFKRAIRAGS